MKGLKACQHTNLKDTHVCLLLRREPDYCATVLGEQQDKSSF